MPHAPRVVNPPPRDAGDVHALVYSASDPCLDGLFTLEGERILFGARKAGEGGVVTDECAHDLAALPPDEAFGEALLAELARTGTRHDPSGEATREVPPAGACGRFFLWSPPDGESYVIGAPLAPHYPESFNRRAVPRPSTPAQLGAAVRAFVDELRRELRDVQRTAGTP